MHLAVIIYNLHENPMFQLDLFELDEMSSLRNEFVNVKKSSDKVRKSLFAKNGELIKMYTELKERVDMLEQKLHKECTCKNTTNGEKE